jgi:preprotein translocase subunit SecG
MYIALIVLHVMACFVLIAVVLLQAGRGGGMSDMLGGGQPQSLFGTQTNQFMTRATEVCAVMFIITSLSLGILSTQRGKSLVERNRFQRAMKATLPAMPGQAAPAPVKAAPVVPAAVSVVPAAPVAQEPAKADAR